VHKPDAVKYLSDPNELEKNNPEENQADILVSEAVSRTTF
jgi:hypothetical protein